MTEELKKKITAHHTEEMADISAYEKLAEEARKCDCEKCRATVGIVDDIIRDEKSHAEILKHILEM